MPLQTIPLGDYRPDLAPLGNPGATHIENLVPRSSYSYRPMPSFAPISSNPLPGHPLGAFSSVDKQGNPAMYVGTAEKLLTANNATNPEFVDASGDTYTTATDDYWSFTADGNYVYATNGTDPIQRVATATADNFAPLSTDAPTCHAIASVQPGFLFCFNINDPTVGINPQGVRWSALGDYSYFPPVGSDEAIANQSDWQNVTGPHGPGRAIAPNLANCNAALFFEQAIFRCIYTGDDRIFDIQPVEKARGIAAARSLVQVGQIAYFLSQDGFYAFDGTQAINIGVDSVNRTFLADVDKNYIASVEGAVDPFTGLIFWSYAGTGNSNGMTNRILVYSPVLKKFTLITGFTGASLFIGRSFGTVLDNIDALGWNIDTLPFSLDSAFLTGGNIVLAAFDANHRYGSFSGPNMAYTIDTNEVQLIPGRRARIRSVRPLVEGAQMPAAAIASRLNLNDPVNFTPQVQRNNTGICPVSGEGMYQRIRLVGFQGNLVTHLLGVEVDFTQGGKR